MKDEDMCATYNGYDIPNPWRLLHDGRNHAAIGPHRVGGLMVHRGKVEIMSSRVIESPICTGGQTRNQILSCSQKGRVS
jgi:hypothetical protein